VLFFFHRWEPAKKVGMQKLLAPLREQNRLCSENYLSFLFVNQLKAASTSASDAVG